MSINHHAFSLALPPPKVNQKDRPKDAKKKVSSYSPYSADWLLIIDQVNRSKRVLFGHPPGDQMQGHPSHEANWWGLHQRQKARGWQIQSDLHLKSAVAASFQPPETQVAIIHLLITQAEDQSFPFLPCSLCSFGKTRNAGLLLLCAGDIWMKGLHCLYGPFK